MKPLKNKTSFYGAYTANPEGYRQFYGGYKQVRGNAWATAQRKILKESREQSLEKRNKNDRKLHADEKYFIFSFALLFDCFGIEQL